MTIADKFAALKDVATRLRIHSVKMTTQAGSGHPSTCCSAADIMAALFFGGMQFDSEEPEEPGQRPLRALEGTRRAVVVRRVGGGRPHSGR